MKYHVYLTEEDYKSSRRYKLLSASEIISEAVRGVIPSSAILEEKSLLSGRVFRASHLAEFSTSKSGAHHQEKTQEEYFRQRAHTGTQYEKKEPNAPPPLSEEIRHARALGLKGKISKEDIRRKYRDLVHKYHPDKVSHLGDEFKELAHRKFREINDAYEYFRSKYNIN